MRLVTGLVSRKAASVSDIWVSSCYFIPFVQPKKTRPKVLKI